MCRIIELSYLYREIRNPRIHITDAGQVLLILNMASFGIFSSVKVIPLDKQWNADFNCGNAVICTERDLEALLSLWDHVDFFSKFRQSTAPYGSEDALKCEVLTFASLTVMYFNKQPLKQQYKCGLENCPRSLHGTAFMSHGVDWPRGEVKLGTGDKIRIHVHDTCEKLS